MRAFQPRRLLSSRLEFLESGGGFEERMWKSKRICVREREMKCTGVCLVVFFFFFKSVPEVVYSDVNVYSRSQSARAYLGWKVRV